MTNPTSSISARAQYPQAPTVASKDEKVVAKTKTSLGQRAVSPLYEQGVGIDKRYAYVPGVVASIHDPSLKQAGKNEFAELPEMALKLLKDSFSVGSEYGMFDPVFISKFEELLSQASNSNNLASILDKEADDLVNSIFNTVSNGDATIDGNNSDANFSYKNSFIGILLSLNINKFLTELMKDIDKSQIAMYELLNTVSTLQSEMAKVITESKLKIYQEQMEQYLESIKNAGLLGLIKGLVKAIVGAVLIALGAVGTIFSAGTSASLVVVGSLLLANGIAQTIAGSMALADPEGFGTDERIQSTLQFGVIGAITTNETVANIVQATVQIIVAAFTMGVSLYNTAAKIGVKGVKLTKEAIGFAIHALDSLSSISGQIASITLQSLDDISEKEMALAQGAAMGLIALVMQSIFIIDEVERGLADGLGEEGAMLFKTISTMVAALGSKAAIGGLESGVALSDIGKSLQSMWNTVMKTIKGLPQNLAQGLLHLGMSFYTNIIQPLLQSSVASIKESLTQFIKDLSLFASRFAEIGYNFIINGLKFGVSIAVDLGDALKLMWETVKHLPEKFILKFANIVNSLYANIIQPLQNISLASIKNGLTQFVEAIIKGVTSFINDLAVFKELIQSDIWSKAISSIKQSIEDFWIASRALNAAKLQQLLNTFGQIYGIQNFIDQVDSTASSLFDMDVLAKRENIKQDGRLTSAKLESQLENLKEDERNLNNVNLLIQDLLSSVSEIIGSQTKLARDMIRNEQV